MSGHSKWSSIKHQKGAADAARGKVFAKMARQIEVAARAGGGDMDANASLRLMVSKARAVSMPKDNIERAIKRGTGEIEGVTYTALNYEGYATHGVAIYVETLTDNKNRTGPEIRTIFSKAGGSLAEPGAVAWQFERKGVIDVPSASTTEDELMEVVLEAGGEDINDMGDHFQVVTAGQDLFSVKTAMEAKGVEVTSSDLTMLPTTLVAIDDPDHAKSVLKVIDALEEHDDVQNVYANCDISDEVLQTL
ncbi:MAG TPA: YebC/PmpR family DNA-binding transcriptional regulator [Acidimicrobiia bacterium]|nr:YebC/PmpR family DNA-binding transcriptional regulator [Acidimicrobiia bacterium]